MKKRFFASVMVALVLVAALATFASAAAVVTINGPVTVQQGETVTLQVEVSGVEGITADVDAMGLEIVSFSGGLSDATSLLLLEDYGGMRATYVYRVTASPGQTASFTLRNVIESQDMVDTNAPDSGWQATVVSGDQQPSESPSAAPSEQPSQATTAPPSESASAPASEAPSESVQPSGEQSAAPASSAPAASDAQQGGQQSQTPAPTTAGSTPPASNGQNGGAVITAVPSNNTTGGTTGGTTVVRLPKTADSTTNMWLFASLTAAVGTIAIIAAKKCSIGKHEAHDEQ